MNRCLLLFGFLLCSFQPLRASQVVLITHGFNADVGEWIIPMANRMANYTAFWGQETSCYQVNVTTNQSDAFVIDSEFIDGVSATQSDTGIIFVKLDWTNVAGSVDGFSVVPARFTTQEIAEAVVPALLDSNLISDLNGHALAEFPLHLIGHSRGGSLVTEMARLLGEEGIHVNQITMLDPHPCVANQFPDSLGCPINDAQPVIYENVLFADNYWQENSSFGQLSGQSVAGAYNRQLTSLPGGYESPHSNVHLWYHGTVELTTPARGMFITETERTEYYAAGETNGAWAGFLYSRIGGGDFASTNQPAGAGAPAIESGLNGARQSLAVNRNNWPNILRVEVLNSRLTYVSEPGLAPRIEGVVHPGPEGWVSLDFYARAVAAVDIDYFLDPDANPLTDNAVLLRTDSFAENELINPPLWSVNLPIDESVPYGIYHLGARISDGTVERHLYATQKVAVLPPLEMQLDGTGSLAVLGAAGYGATLEISGDFGTWNPFDAFVFPGETMAQPSMSMDQLELTGPGRYLRARYYRP